MRSVWFSPRAVGLHTILVVLTPTFILLFLWQVRRATSGNTLSWAYVFEWPFFLGYLVYMWWRLIHEPTAERPDVAGPGDAPTGASAPPTATVGAAPADHHDPRHAPRAGDPVRPASADSASTDGSATGAEHHEDEDLAAYNRYLAELNATGRRKRW